MLLKDLRKSGHIEVMKIHGTENLADMFTKPLTWEQFAKRHGKLPGMCWNKLDEDYEAGLLKLIGEILSWSSRPLAQLDVLEAG